MDIFLYGDGTDSDLSSKFTVGYDLTHLESEEFEESHDYRSLPYPLDLENILREYLTHESRELYASSISTMGI